jgi:hypothetical protein
MTHHFVDSNLNYLYLKYNGKYPTTNYATVDVKLNLPEIGIVIINMINHNHINTSYKRFYPKDILNWPEGFKLYTKEVKGMIYYKGYTQQPISKYMIH